MKKNMLKQQIKAGIYCFVICICVFLPILGCEALFYNTRNYLILLGACVGVLLMAFDGLVNAARKVYRMRQRAIELQELKDAQEEDAA